MEVVPVIAVSRYHHIDNGGLMFYVSKDYAESDVKVEVCITRYESSSRFEFNLPGDSLAQLEMIRDAANEAIEKLKALKAQE